VPPQIPDKLVAETVPPIGTVCATLLVPSGSVTHATIMNENC
jgi:hypothetical protein